MDTRQRAPLCAPAAKPAATPAAKPLWGAGAPRWAPERKDDGGGRGSLDHECEVKFAEGEEDAGVIEGYASKWGILDRGGDIVEKGAFKASLADWKRKKAMPPILWQHDAYTPIGIWTELEEDDVGLKCKGQLLLDIPQAIIVRSLIKAKAVRGFSIGYETIERQIDRGTGVRHLKRVNLWEISPVTFPMLPEALITGVKGGFDPKSLERQLRDEAGLSHSEAKAAVSVFKTALRDAGSNEPGARDGATEMLMTLRKAAEALR